MDNRFIQQINYRIILIFFDDAITSWRNPQDHDLLILIKVDKIKNFCRANSQSCGLAGVVNFSFDSQNMQ